MPPLSLSGFSPTTQIGAILYKIIRRSRGETIGTRIDRDNSLIMPLRLRGGYATECHAFSYYTSSSALHFLAAVAARTLNKHNPFISAF